MIKKELNIGDLWENANFDGNKIPMVVVDRILNGDTVILISEEVKR